MQEEDPEDRPRTDPDLGTDSTTGLGRRRWRGRIVTIGLLVLAGLVVVWEARTFTVEAQIGSQVARRLTFRLEPGPSDSIAFPLHGPFDERRGYVRIPAITRTLTERGFAVTDQARWSPWMLALHRLGMNTIAEESTQAGLSLLDRIGRPLYSVAYPQRVYATFDDIPGFAVASLLYIENRELLDPKHPYRNPAVEWDRLVKAIVDLGLGMVDKHHPQPGGSTLATQTEKFRHSPEGITGDPKDKLLQMASASLRAYRTGANTTDARRNIVLEYVNTVPLAAVPGFGEVNGLGDGLWAWFDANFDSTNRLLRDLEEGRAPTPERAEAFKRVVSLFIAHRRPSGYLISNRVALERDTNGAIKHLAAEGMIPVELRDAALAVPLRFRATPAVSGRPLYFEQKAANAIRTRLLNLLQVAQLYELDRIQLTASTTLDGPIQRRLSHRLERLGDPEVADSMGLRGYRLLERGDPAGVIYSFMLYETTPRGNLLRLQADNYNQPLDINEGAKLDLGSTAKLRTMTNYLEIVADLHHRHAGRPIPELARERNQARDSISRWAFEWLIDAQDSTLVPMLDAALDRRYSANPNEKFFTAGGLHTFVNFDKEDDSKVLSVREALQQSVNLVFIRLMRDMTRYYEQEIPGYSPELWHDPDHPLRREYLTRFAESEGKEFLRQFHRKYRGKGSDEAIDLLAGSLHGNPSRVAALYRAARPKEPVDAFTAFLRRYGGTRVTESRTQSLYQMFRPDAYDMHDRAYIMRVHPLELWLVCYVQDHPGAGWGELVEASRQARVDAYKWLFDTHNLETQNKRIRISLEADAFQLIHKAWARVGYPFDQLVPSYATSIGTSGDRPAALAELVGILVNDGIRRPTQRLETLHFAEGTPYETRFEYRGGAVAEPVLRPEVARAARRVLVEVVEKGTARRAYQAFKLPDGTVIPVGGKTGTGDHRFETFGRGGQLLESKVMNRTATFVFFIGDRFYGALSAYVPGPEAAGYSFTSALPVQLLAALAPELMPLVAPPQESAVQVEETPPTP
jgi:membrane peptidoglycan carboxypeptidase